MPAAVDIQQVVVLSKPVQMLVDTVELVVDTVTAADTLEDPEVDTVIALDQEQGLDMELVQLDMGLMLEECRQADCWYIVLCFPYFFL